MDRWIYGPGTLNTPHFPGDQKAMSTSKLVKRRTDMKRRTITSVALSLTLALFLIPSASAECQGGNKVTQNFHQVYNLAADGRVALENINGNAQIEAWDSNQVQIDAVKTACSQEDLDSVKIDVRGSQDAVRIATHYL